MTDNLRWLIVGANGMLGKDLAVVLKNKKITTLDKSQCDISNFDQVRKIIKDVDVVVNCAAYTAVDEAESNIELCYAVNADGPKNLATVCKEINAKFILISTDYVFDGESKTPYFENDLPNPKSIYGKSKLAGEQAVKSILENGYYIIRTAWLYGKNGKHFGKTILNLAKSNSEVRVVTDQIGQPTWTVDLSHKILELVESHAIHGVYHGTSQGSTSWYEFAKEIFKLADLDVERLIGVSTSEFPRPAKRPSNSVLGHRNFDVAGLSPIRHWKEALVDSFNSGVFSE